MWIVKWEAFKDLISIQDRINKFFDDTIASTLAENQGEWVPPVDIYESTGEIVITFELPGVLEEGIDLKVAKNTFTIKGDKQPAHDKKSENYYRLERPYGKFIRSFALPNMIDVENIKASLKDGILKVTIPKLESDENTIISVTKED